MGGGKSEPALPNNNQYTLERGGENLSGVGVNRGEIQPLGRKTVTSEVFPSGPTNHRRPFRRGVASRKPVALTSSTHSELHFPGFSFFDKKSVNDPKIRPFRADFVGSVQFLRAGFVLTWVI